MKKISQMLMLLVTGSTLSFGAAVPVKTAKSVGYNYLTQHGGEITNMDDLQLIYTSATAHEDFYVFGTNSCFVIVSADDAVSPILGYSSTNRFGADHMPSNLAYFLDNFNSQIEYAKNNGLTASEETTAEWAGLMQNIRKSAAKTTAAVTPLLTTEWDQGQYYDALCPADALATSSGGHAVTGCVATAMAQVMRYWRWPNTGIGSSSYASGYGVLSANFATTTYRWNLMPATVSSSNVHVATLMSHAGISVDMDYTAEESGAYVTIMSSPITNCAEYALETYFNYKPSLVGKKRSSYSDASWISMLKVDLDAGRPVLVDGSGSAGGHNFIFDGYDATNKFHVNWGWSGASDGYFSINALNPPALGIGGGGGGFNSNQHAIFGIEPNGTPTPLPTPDIYEVNNTAATAYTLPLTWTGNNATKTTTGSNFHVTTDIDYYKIKLPAGYNYTISARVNDAMANNDTTKYTGDAQWAYSLNGGTTWSSTYDSTMTTTINVTNLTGTVTDSVVFRVVQRIPGTTGTYVLKLSNVNRRIPSAIDDVAMSTVKVFPNPANDQVSVDLSETGVTAISATLTDLQGRQVYAADVNGQSLITIPVTSLASGLYILNIATDAGIINRKITVAEK